MKIIASFLDIETLLHKFGDYLLSTAGLAARTIATRRFYAREFLQAQLKSSRRRFVLQELTPEILLSYVLERSNHDSPARLQALGAALRSFCRFLCVKRLIARDLSSAVPRIGSLGNSYLPNYLLLEQLNDLLGSIDRQNQAGLRNYAIILCLSRLGLRASEVARLTFEQMDWRASVLRLRPAKGRRERTLPLSKEVGRAIAHYLRERSGTFKSRHLFCGLRNGLPLSPAAISQVTRRALSMLAFRSPEPVLICCAEQLLRIWYSEELISRRWPIY